MRSDPLRLGKSSDDARGAPAGGWLPGHPGRWRARAIAAGFAAALAGVPALCAGHGVVAAARAPPTGAPSFADAQALHDALLQVRAQAAWLRDRAPRGDDVEVFVERPAGDREARSFAIVVDGGPPLVLALEAVVTDTPDASALRRAGRLRLGSGSHVLHVSLTGTSAPPSADVPFDAPPGSSCIVVRPRAGGLLRRAGFEVVAWRGVPPAATGNPLQQVLGPDLLSVVASQRVYTQGGAADPRVRDARGLLDAGRADDAVVELREMALGAGADSLPQDYWLAVLPAERAAGLLDDAEVLSARLAARHVDRRRLAVEQLHLADAEFEAGRLTQAQGLLDRCRAELPSHMDLDWRFEQAQLMFERDQTDAALSLLRVANREDIEAFRYLVDAEGSARSASYRRFNLAVALLAHNRNQLGLSWLDLVGRYRGGDRDLLALRDRANLTMGWRFLQLREGRSAIAALGRVSSEGPYANAALLGIGWCQIAPAGRWLSRGSLGNEQADAPDPFGALPPVMRHSLEQLHVLEPELNGEFGPLAFAETRPPASHQEALRRAVEIWKILVARDADDPAVEEAVVAIAYATGQLGDRTRSWDAYNDAATKLGAVEAALQRNVAFLRRGGLAAAVGQARDTGELYRVMERLRLPPGEPTRTLYSVIDRYRARQDGLAALAGVRRSLASSSDAAAVRLLRSLPSLEQALHAEQAADARRLEEAALRQLQARRHTLDRYLLAASEAMMRYAQSQPAPTRAEAPSRMPHPGS